MGIRPEQRGRVRRPAPSDFGGEPVFYRASDLSIIGTQSELEQEALMARLRGTGKDDRYIEGQIFDVPAYDPLYDELIESGLAEEIEADEDPGRSIEQIANSVVRGDLLSNPVEAAIADSMSPREARTIVHGSDPDTPRPTGRLIRGVGEAAADLTPRMAAEEEQAREAAMAGSEPEARAGKLIPKSQAEGGTAQAEGGTAQADDDGDGLESMTVAQLRELADENDVELASDARKDDIVSALRDAGVEGE